MKITNFNPVMLENAVKLSGDNNPYTEVYRLNSGRIFKALKLTPNGKVNPSLSYMHFYNSFCHKLGQADSLRDVDSLVLPDEISRQDNGVVRGYFYSYDDTPDISAFFDKNPNRDEIGIYFEKLLDTLELLHERKVIAPDLITSSNVLYDSSTGDVRLIDYDGLQIENIPTNAISSELFYRRNRILRNKKYSKPNGIYNTEIDNLSLFVFYLQRLSGVNVAALPQFQGIYSEEAENDITKETTEQIEELFEGIGASSIASDYISLFSSKRENPDPKKLMKKLEEVPLSRKNI